jgi:glutamate formiminotransferase
VTGQLVECVPNFSEGRDAVKIERIAAAVRGVPGVKLLDVAPDPDHNRTVLTFVGEPATVKQAAYGAIATAADLIDMAEHKGQHPRLGACDVCPFVPVQNVTMADCVVLAHELGREVGENLNIPVYLYEQAAASPHRKSLAAIRAGEYEGLSQKLKDPRWQPDYGPAVLNEKSGATVIGAREFLIAYNVYLRTPEAEIAHGIAMIIRESGWLATLADGRKLRVPGTLRSVKAVGIALDRPGLAQVSMNLTSYRVAPMHLVFETIRALADLADAGVVSSEIVGLVPGEALLEAGRFYERGEESHDKLVAAAVKNLALDVDRRFDPREKIIEYLIEEDQECCSS